MNEVGPSPQEKAKSWHREQRQWPWSGDWPQIENMPIQTELKERVSLLRNGDCPLFSWFSRGSIIEWSWDAAIQHSKRELPALPDIPENYVWKCLPWDDGSPNHESHRKLALCDNCGAKCYLDEHHELICVSCGLVQHNMSSAEGWSKDQYGPIQYHLKDDGAKEKIWSFTDSEYIEEKFLRCRGQFVYGFTSAHCNHDCRRCRYAMETSLKEREEGAHNIDLFLRYPFICTHSFDNVPSPVTPVSAKELSWRYRTSRRLGYPSCSHPTIKKWLMDPERQRLVYRVGRVSVMGPDIFVRLTSRYWIDYGSYLKFMFTPMDIMLRERPIEGAHAIQKLKSIRGRRGKKKSDFKPTGQNLKEILGESSFNLLVQFKIILGYTLHTGKSSEMLYFAPRYFYQNHPEMVEDYKKYKDSIYKIMNNSNKKNV
jgi:hypothetical protein